MSGDSEDEVKHLTGSESAQQKAQRDFNFHANTVVWLTTGQMPTRESGFWRRLVPKEDTDGQE